VILLAMAIMAVMTERMQVLLTATHVAAAAEARLTAARQQAARAM
jgi:hypothetical protein